MFKLMFKAGKGLEKWGEQQSEKIRKSMATALKREGFLLAGDLRKEIKAGAPGGQAYPKLSSIARWDLKRFTSRKPFTGLESTTQANLKQSKGMIPIRYNPLMDGRRLGVEIGLVDTRLEKMSGSWKRIFMKQQEGFTSSISKLSRARAIRTGARISKGSRLRKHFFLLKKTTTFKTPARPVIDPFWQKWEKLSMQRMSDNFHKKMAGQRI
ncbi:MAG: hypothetical protein ABIG61_16440 [Planctomycetota bacterium]